LTEHVLSTSLYPSRGLYEWMLVRNITLPTPEASVPVPLLRKSLYHFLVLERIGLLKEHLNLGIVRKVCLEDPRSVKDLDPYDTVCIRRCLCIVARELIFKAATVKSSRDIVSNKPTGAKCPVE